MSRKNASKYNKIMIINLIELFDYKDSNGINVSRFGQTKCLCKKEIVAD